MCVIETYIFLNVSHVFLQINEQTNKKRLLNEYVYELPLRMVLLFKNIMPEDQLSGVEKRAWEILVGGSQIEILSALCRRPLYMQICF